MLIKLTYKNLKSNKKRTIVTILGIVFSSALLFGVGILISTIRDSGLRESKENYGSHHIYVNNINKNEKKIIDSQSNIEKKIYESLINSTEIDIKDEMGSKYKVDLLSYNVKYDNYIKLHKGNYPKLSSEILVSRSFIEYNKLKLNDSYSINNDEYKIVGIYNNSKLRQYRYYQPSILYEENIYTIGDSSSIKLNAYISFTSTNKLFDKIEIFSTNINRKINVENGIFSYEDIKPNYSVINYYSRDLNKSEVAILFLSILILGSVLGMFCTFVIYNSFAISVNSRKKMFGILSSIGAHKSQLLRTVLIEALLVSMVAIPIGLLLSISLSSGVITVINNIMGDFLLVPYQLSIYPLFLFICLIMIVIVIFISAYRPAKIASLVSPIEAIRMNKDYKLNKRKLKSSYIIERIFGIEASIAFLNLKRNKKRYRITIISIVISIVLFIVISTYINFAIVETNKNAKENYQDYSISLCVEANIKSDEFFNKLKRLDYIDEIIGYRSTMISHPPIDKNLYDSKYKEIFVDDIKQSGGYDKTSTNIISVDKDSYDEIIRKNNIKIEKNQPIIANYGFFQTFNQFDGAKGKTYNLKFYKDDSNLNFKICERDNSIIKNCYDEINNIFITNKYLSDVVRPSNILVTNDYYNLLIKKPVFFNQLSFSKSLTIGIKSDSYRVLDNNIKNLIEEYPGMKINYYNYNMESYEQNMTYITIKIVLYIFLGFVAVIAITSMFNTINTSMELRRGEFATLRSIGISPSGFKKMIVLESIFFGIKSLLYGLVVSLLIIFGIFQLFNLSSGNLKLTLPFPTMYIIFTIISVMLIIGITMFYSIRKIKKDNIITTIRNESI